MWWARYWEMAGGVGVFMRGAPCIPGGSEDKIFARGVNFAPLAAGNRPRGAQTKICRREPERSLRHILYLYWGVSALSMSVIKTRRLRGDANASPALRGAEAMRSSYSAGAASPALRGVGRCPVSAARKEAMRAGLRQTRLRAHRARGGACRLPLRRSTYGRRRAARSHTPRSFYPARPARRYTRQTA